MFKKFLAPFLSHKYLLNQLTLREIKGRYKQSIIGYAWVLVNPLTQLLVYSFVFSTVFRFPTGDIPYPIFLFVGLIPWIFFQTSLSSATTSLVENSDLLRKVYFPREVFPYSAVLAKSVDFFFAASLVLLFMLYYRIPLHSSALFVIPLIFMQVILTIGVSFFTSSFNLFYRDIQYLLNLILLIWLYLTPVIYPLSLVPKKFLLLYQLNPMAGIIEGYRSALFDKPIDIVMIIWSFSISFAIFIIGYIIFKRTERIFADVV